VAHIPRRPSDALEQETEPIRTPKSGALPANTRIVLKDDRSPDLVRREDGRGPRLEESTPMRHLLTGTDDRGRSWVVADSEVELIEARPGVRRPRA
jgi:hypothetical protein